MLLHASLFIILGCLQLLIPTSTYAQIEKDPEASLVCVQIQVVDLAQISGATMYASSPLSNDPNTINICQPADFEISDDPFVPQGRCHVPPAEGGNPEMFILYLLSSNQAATLPATGTVVPQASGPWSTVLNAASIPAYNQNNFPPPTGAGIFNAFSISTPGQYAVIAVLCTLNANNQYEIVTANAGSPVSDKVNINFLDTTQPLVITGEQYLCEGASNVYSIPSNLAGFNPQWTVVGGTFVSNGTSIQVNWSTPYTANSRVSVTLQLNEGGCELSASLNTFECCIVGHDSIYYIYNKSLSQTALAGIPVVNSTTTPYTRIMINGVFHVDANTTFENMAIHFGPHAKITLADNVHLIIKGIPQPSAPTSPSVLRAGCQVMFDGIYAVNPTQQITLEYTGVIDAINGLVSIAGGKLNVANSSFSGCRTSIQIKNYNPSFVSNYNGNISPCSIYGTTFIGGFTYLSPYALQSIKSAIEVSNSGFVVIGNRNQQPNRFDASQPLFNKLPQGIIMTNSGGNIVNNQFLNINVVGSPSQTGAILATTSQHQPWIAPLQIGRLWTGGAAGDVNHFDQGYQAIKTTNVRSVFILDNTFKDYSSNITVINASNHRVIQGNKINFQLGSSSNPNRSGSGIVVSSTHGLPTPGGAVWGNHVEACRQGIFLTTVNSMTISDNTIRTFSTAGASQSDARAGISASNGWNLIIRQNNLQHNTMAPNSDLSGNNLRGISLNNVVDAFVWDNYVLRYGAGIHAANDNRVSQFRCNFLVGSIWGFNFDNVYLDQQGNQGDPTDNQWVSNRRAIRTNGTEDNMPPTPWFHRTGGEFSPFNLGAGMVFTTPQLTAGNEVECSNVVLPDDTIPKDEKYEDPEVFEDVFAKVVDSSIQFSSDAVQYFEESMTYRILDQYPAIIQQTSSSQQAFDDFYTAHNASSKGDVKRLYDALLANTPADVEQSLSALQPNNTFETKIAEVSAIYAQSWAVGRFELDSAERSVLLPIAQADASVWGEAVYTARVMLGIFDLDGNIGAANQRRALYEEVIADVAIGTAYPNPTKGSFSFEGSIETGLEKAEVKMYDLQGRFMASPKTTFADGVWQVANPNLNAGMYLYRFYIDGMEVQHGKIVIQ